MRSSYFYNAISASSREGQSISSDGLGLLKFVQPGAAAQNAFYVAMEPLLTRAKSSQSESRTLAALCDTLLPKLISGELRVGETHIARSDGL
jgi:type I restriction enzyme S subunit